MKLTQEQLQAIWEETPFETLVDIETKNEEEVSPVKAIFFDNKPNSAPLFLTPMFFDSNGEEITEEEFNQN